jgi:Baseplate J-like protein
MNGRLFPELCLDDDERRSDLLEHATLNAIDYVEVDPGDHRKLKVFFAKPLPPADSTNAADVHDAYGITTHLRRIRIDGGTRIVGIRPVSASRNAEGYLDLTVNRAGDFSPYVLTIDVAQLEPHGRSLPFSFMAACPVDIDCPAGPECPLPVVEEPAFDYLAKDYASFRRLLLDLLPQLNPRFVERNPSDVGIALIELLAYLGDQLSYFQDAVGNEAYLSTLRRRISARRHAKLVDYRMHDGRNAWTWAQFAVDGPCTLPAPPWTTKIVTRLRANPARMPAASAPGLFLDPGVVTVQAIERDPSFAGAAIFETAHGAELDPAHNEIRLHAWGNEDCCLPTGTTDAYLYSVRAGQAVVRPRMKAGDFLLLEEVLGPATGLRADADPSHRQVVRIEAVEAVDDPLYADRLDADGDLRRWTVGNTLPLLHVRWSRDDTLAFPLCLSARTDEGALVRNVSVARGNLVLADHGLGCSERIDRTEPVPEDASFSIRLSFGPLTMECRAAAAQYDPITMRLRTPRTKLDCSVDEAQPSVALVAEFANGERESWFPVPDLLDSGPADQAFVAEVDDDGRALLRAGDNEYGRSLAGAVRFEAYYRVGNGSAGNVGADTLAHLVLPPNDVFCRARITAVRNPLAAQGGVEPETIEEVRIRAPAAFHARPLRAVTEADYARAAQELPEIAGAVATFRWTGSWFTVYVAVDPRDPDDLVTDPDGRTQLSSRFAETVASFLATRRLAGYDIEIRPPDFVPLELEVEVCAAPGHFRADVRRAVERALGPRGLFDPANFTFGQSVYLSQIYAAVERVPGVASSVVRVFRRYGRDDRGELDAGELPVGPWQIARLDNDPSFVEHGVLAVRVEGGKG